ncbi:MAG: selenide, water dikinase SelD [Actinobacteria bacterium]|nr:selenide, water dikinase SelD [Actinomycetota bacterium]
MSPPPPIEPAEVRLTSYSHAGGCGCKLSPLELAEVMRHVPVGGVDPAVLVGLDSPDDAGVYRLTPDLAMVQTIDFFTPIVDDAYDWGRIAATNALSDVYAMGGRPVSALNLVGWPRTLGFELLGRVLEGGAAACAEAAVTVIGGHSIDDPEPKFGLAVTGVVAPDGIVRSRGAQPGDALILTKPLGMGIVSSGIKESKTSDATAAEAIRVMTTLNRAASEAMVSVGVSAATDVTGFGLIGHLLEMLDGSLSAELNFDLIPVLLESIDLARDGVLPGGSRRNHEAMGSMVESPALDEARRLLLFDAQTSGGLLIAVAPGKEERLHEGLAERGVKGAATIGRVSAGDGRVTVTLG